MSQCEPRILSSGKRTRLIRRLILTIVVTLLVGGVFFVLSQTTNKLMLVNNGSESRMVAHVTIGTNSESADYSSDELLSPTSLVKDHAMPPHTKLTLTFSGRRYPRRLVVTRESALIENRMGTFMTTASWGSRLTIGWDDKNEPFNDRQPSTLRGWYDSIRPWLPLPASWRE